jgi:hypothetical protein
MSQPQETTMPHPKTLTLADLESVYDLLAEAIDATPPEQTTLMLSKLALLLAQALGDRDQVAALVQTARRDL